MPDTPPAGVASTALRGRLPAGLLVVWLAWAGGAAAAPGAVPDSVRQQARSQGAARVIVALDVPSRAEGRLASAGDVARQRVRIASAQDRALAVLAGTAHRVTRRFGSIPFVALEASPAALDALERSDLVVGVEPDRAERPVLAASTPLVEATDAVAAGLDGTGQVVAVLDTGVDSLHPFLSGRIVAEGCFSDGRDCPNRGTTQTGDGAGAPCSYAVSGCRHGTHVAGIAAGDGASFDGVAPGARIIAVQVFSRFTGPSCFGAGENPCALSFVSDQIAGLEYLLSLRQSFAIAAVNMSIGGATFTSQAQCDAQNAARKAAIDNLRSFGIATVISSGNDGLGNALSEPGCISSAVSVGSTTKTDAISSFSNSASFLSLLAPGSSIDSSVPGGGFAVFSGTSMAAPHVTGAWAILRQHDPTASADEVLGALASTGVSIDDARNGIARPRIRVASAAAVLGCGPDPGGSCTPPVPAAGGIARGLVALALLGLGSLACRPRGVR
jgi:subtilisin family serine protease